MRSGGNLVVLFMLGGGVMFTLFSVVAWTTGRRVGASGAGGGRRRQLRLRRRAADARLRELTPAGAAPAVAPRRGARAQTRSVKYSAAARGRRQWSVHIPGQ